MTNLDDLKKAPTWKPIPGYEGAYEASDDGQIRSVDRTVDGPGGFPKRVKGAVLAQSTHPNGYKRANLYKGGKGVTRGVHQLVMLAFVGPPPRGMEVCHNNGDKANNCLTNLRYDTKSANQIDRVKHGANEKANRTHCPRGHKLSVPNLVVGAYAKGGRQCLSCARARNHMHRKRLTYDQFVAMSHKYYEKLQVENG